MNANTLQQEIEVLLLMSEGEITPEIDDLMKLQLKAENLEQNIAWLLVKYEINESLLKSRTDRLETVKKKVETAKRSSEYWKNKIAEELVRNDLPSLKLKEYDLFFRKSESVQIYSEEDIPTKFIKEKIEKSPDKIAIKDAIKAGETVPGAQLDIKENLQIKS
jgi:hypothetical protein